MASMATATVMAVVVRRNLMDVLHSDMQIARVPYTPKDLDVDPGTADLTLTRRLALTMAVNRGTVLHTADPALLAHAGLPVRGPEPADDEAEFPPYLEKLYAASLALRTGL